MWKVIETEICIENQYITSYGIGGETVEIADISIVREEIEEFVALLNKLSASEIHAYNFAEDFLASRSQKPPPLKPKRG